MVAHVPVLQESTSQQEEMSSTVDSVNVSSSRDSDVGDISPKVRPVSVETANNKNGRLWDKKHCCLFCTKMCPKLPRHLEQIHSTEVEVAAALAFPKKSKERKLRWDDLRNRGNFSHNTQVIKKGSGGIVPYRRPALDTDPMTYVPCSACLAFFYKGGPVETCRELSQAASLSITQYEGHSSSTPKSKCCTSSCQ